MRLAGILMWINTFCLCLRLHTPVSEHELPDRKVHNYRKLHFWRPDLTAGSLNSLCPMQQEILLYATIFAKLYGLISGNLNTAITLSARKLFKVALN